MRTAKILMTVLLLGAAIWVGAQAARPAASAPEMFSGTAQIKNATGAASGTIEVRLSRYTPDFDRNDRGDGAPSGWLPAVSHDPSERARGRAARARRRRAVRDPVCAREGRRRWPNDRRRHRQTRVLCRRRAHRPQGQAASRIRSGRAPDSGGRNGTGEAGRWPAPRACDPMATAACCSTTTPRSPSC